MSVEDLERIKGRGSGVYRYCRGCRTYRPICQFHDKRDTECRACHPPVVLIRCRQCGKAKPPSAYHVDRKAATGRRAECIGCRNKAYANWRANREVRRDPRDHNDDHLNRLTVMKWA